MATVSSASTTSLPRGSTSASPAAMAISTSRAYEKRAGSIVGSAVAGTCSNAAAVAAALVRTEPPHASNSDSPCSAAGTSVAGPPVRARLWYRPRKAVATSSCSSLHTPLADGDAQVSRYSATQLSVGCDIKRGDVGTGGLVASVRHTAPAAPGPRRRGAFGFTRPIVPPAPKRCTGTLAAGSTPRLGNSSGRTAAAASAAPPPLLWLAMAGHASTPGHTQRAQPD
mmetsp:Transcript_20029/g.52014  ORF Transcript_20029/g.52014 Transcript_20029/m.52014 type:complete len:226 (-) Transcript_20029:158-835(-)